MLRYVVCCYLAILAIQAAPVFAGSVTGPNVVWVNLDATSGRERVNEIIEKFANDKETDCDGRWHTGQSLLYMKVRPKMMNDDLIRGVFFNKNASQKKYLNRLLKSYTDDEVYDGFDGIIVYSSQEGVAQMMSLTTGKNKTMAQITAINGKSSTRTRIEDAFCAVLPPITRKP